MAGRKCGSDIYGALEEKLHAVRRRREFRKIAEKNGRRDDNNGMHAEGYSPG